LLLDYGAITVVLPWGEKAAGIVYPYLRKPNPYHQIRISGLSGIPAYIKRGCQLRVSLSIRGGERRAVVDFADADKSE
jgi:hypothetical protein